MQSKGDAPYRETIYDGIENAPKALIGMLNGANTGKMLVRLSGRRSGRYRSPSDFRTNVWMFGRVRDDLRPKQMLCRLGRHSILFSLLVAPRTAMLAKHVVATWQQRASEANAPPIRAPFDPVLGLRLARTAVLEKHVVAALQ